MEFGSFDQCMGETFQGVLIALFSFTSRPDNVQQPDISGRAEGNERESTAIASKLNNLDNS